MATLLCIHGSGHTADSFKPQTDALPSCRALVLPGHPHGEALSSVAAYTEWLEVVCKLPESTRPVIAGNSLGGAIAMAYALSRPERVGGLILIGTGARLKVSAAILTMLVQEWPQCIDTLVDYSLAPQADAALRGRIKSWHEAVGQESTRRDYEACDKFDIMEEVAHIRVPTLIIVGGDDRMTPPKYARFLAARIPNAQLEVVEAAGHMPHAERPETVNRLINGFVGQIEAA
ncbi:MAG: alpha/beta hydrolase [Candidatus Eremiobacteraeota bacterium]|nr:alpha/beta hydrolase [Candidatus Eremiobacteraeota bacterium]MBC5826956.1 alpha/beta hydrolase [Candidatus Eremiobacteraeota bacterium]